MKRTQCPQDHFETLQVTAHETSIEDEVEDAIASLSSATAKPPLEPVTEAEISAIVQISRTSGRSALTSREKIDIYVAANSNLPAPVKLSRKPREASCSM
jgi:precorrin-4 methylase